MNKAWLMFAALTACGGTGIDGEWCGAEVDSPEACENTGQSNDMWYASLTEDGDTVSGQLCEDGYASHAKGDCLDVSGPYDGTVLRLGDIGKDARDLDLELDGDSLSGVLTGCSTCDGVECACDVPITLYRIQ